MARDEIRRNILHKLWRDIINLNNDEWRGMEYGVILSNHYYELRNTCQKWWLIQLVTRLTRYSNLGTRTRVQYILKMYQYISKLMRIYICLS